MITNNYSEVLILDRKIKKLRLHIDYLRLELDEVREINLKCQSKFNQDFAEILSEVNTPKPEAKSKIEIEEDTVAKKPDENTLKLFKDIALKTHPDKKLTKTDELFVKANEAKEKNDLSTLIDIAEELDINVDEYVNDPLLLETYIGELNREIQGLKVQLAWIWFHASEEEKIPLRDVIINHIKSNS